MHLDWRGRPLFVKISPNRGEIVQEIVGHALLRDYYPVPALVWHHAFGSWAVSVYERHGDGTADTGLFLDHITGAERTGGTNTLDVSVSRIVRSYARVIDQTLERVPQRQTVTKLYGDRTRAGGRLDAYYGDDRPLLTLGDDEPVRPSDLARTTLIINGRSEYIDFDALISWLRRTFVPDSYVWAAITQGDPTDLNIGDGPVWFDYDTAGSNALAGEFACFLWYQRLHGGWLVPAYNPATFVDHPATLDSRDCNRPSVRVTRTKRKILQIDYNHQPSAARRRVIAFYLRGLVQPLASPLGITDLLDWLRPYLVLRIIGVHNLRHLTPQDAALSLALLAEVLNPESTLEDVLGLNTSLPVKGQWPSPAQ